MDTGIWIYTDILQAEINVIEKAAKQFMRSRYTVSVRQAKNRLHGRAYLINKNEIP